MEPDLTKKIAEHGASLRCDFNPKELQDIVDSLDLFKDRIGNLKRYGFSIGKSEFNLERYAWYMINHPEREGQNFWGYSHSGFVDNKTLYISLMPKEEHENLYEVVKESIPKEEKVISNRFKKTIVHELMHVLGFKLYHNAMYERSMPLETDSEFILKWFKLNKKINENAKPLKESSEGYCELKRPEGYPTLYSYLEEGHELFADCGVYILLRQNHANHDKLLMERITLMNKEFDRIKKEQPPLNEYKALTV